MTVWVKDIWNAFLDAAMKPSSILALCYAIIVFFAGQGIDYYKSGRQSQQKIVESRVTAFVETTKEFDALVPLLAHAIMDTGKADSGARGRLVANLNRQYTDAQELAPILGPRADVLREYTLRLTALNNELPSVEAIGDMKEYWESVSGILVARKALTTELRRRANLALD